MGASAGPWADRTYPPWPKAGGHYTDSQLIAMEAKDRGFAEGITLDVFGYVSEGSGENIFIVRDGTLYTSPLSSSILGGVTRRCVIALAGDPGIPVREEPISRERLYLGVPSPQGFPGQPLRRSHPKATSMGAGLRPRTPRAVLLRSTDHRGTAVQGNTLLPGLL